MLDLVIVGAGAAGLGAAKAAMSKGLSFQALEAAPYIGGRARTDTDRLCVPYDLGCRTLYGGSANPFVAYAREIGSRLGPAPQNLAFHDGIRFLDDQETANAGKEFERFEAELVTAHEKLAVSSNFQDRSQADIVDSDHPLAGFFLQSMHPSLVPAADVSLADPGFTSLLIQGDDVLDGFGSLILQAAAEVPVTVDCPVTAIDLSGPHVVVETPNGQLEAQAVIVTVSTAVLAAERITLRPNGWPASKQAAIEAVPMTSTTKIGLQLRPGVLPSKLTAATGSLVLFPSSEPGSAFWILGMGGVNLATAYVGGPFSRDLALAGEDAQVDWATGHLSKLLGNSIQGTVQQSCATPFDREPWIDGGQSYCRYGTDNQRPALAEPIEDRVFFAGEACSLDSPGTAHGAWLSGRTAIDRICRKETSGK